MLMYRRTDSLEVIGYSDSNFAGCVVIFSSYLMELYLGEVRNRPRLPLPLWKLSSYLVLRLARMVYG